VAKAPLLSELFVMAEAMTHKPRITGIFWDTTLDTDSRIVFVGRGFSRDIREREKKGFSP